MRLWINLVVNIFGISMVPHRKQNFTLTCDSCIFFFFFFGIYLLIFFILKKQKTTLKKNVLKFSLWISGMKYFLHFTKICCLYFFTSYFCFFILQSIRNMWNHKHMTISDKLESLKLCYKGVLKCTWPYSKNRQKQFWYLIIFSWVGLIEKFSAPLLLWGQGKQCRVKTVLVILKINNFYPTI